MSAPPTAAPRRPGLRLPQLLTLTDQTDQTGRLLLEDSAPAPAVRRAERAGVPMDTVTCSYQDTPSRVGGRMNASAYEVLRRDTADILNGFAWLGRHGEEGAPRRLFLTSYLGVTLAMAMFHRAQDPVASYGELPSYVASIFKASRGIFSYSVDLMNRVGPAAAMTAADVLRDAEEHHHLVRPQTGRVCAAPTRLIERTLAAIITGEGADASRSTLGELVDFAVLWELYELQDRFGQALSAYRVVLENLSREAGPAADPNRLFDTRLPDGTSVGQRTAALLALADEVQRGMNRALGRAENARPLAYEDILRML
nr:hypothetical protein [uncultured bacterium]